MFLQERFLHSCSVLEAPSWGVKDVAKWRCVPEGTLAYLASRLPLIVLIRRAEPVVFFCEVFLAEHIDGFGWISRRLGGAGWVVRLSSHRSLCEGHLVSEMGWGEREVFLQEHFVVLRGSIDPTVYAKWRSVPEGTLWKTHIHGPGLARINRSIVGS
jgi:hypothetical protein